VSAKKYLLAGLVVGLVALMVVVGITLLGAPRPAPGGSASTSFSAGRAMVILRQVAAEPRPIGSRQAARVRASIVARLSALGLSPHVQRADVVSAEDGRVAGTVRNVVARLPGTAPSRSVLLVCHYDSVPVAPGAADDGGGVATLLETARALAAGPRPRNDVVFLFTDGEERGLLGARAFLRDDPWAYGVGVVLNFDSPGSSSPALMYQTSRGNGRLVSELLSAAPHPFTSSLMYEVSRRVPVESDMHPFLVAGVPGMSFGALDGPAYDHTAYDSLADFDPASLQHEGETALTLARRFGAEDLWDLHRPDLVAFDIVGSVAVSYGQGWVVPFVALAGTLFAAAVAVATRRRLLTLRGLGLSVLGTAAALAVALLLTAVAWGMYRSAYEQRIWSETGVVISDLYRVGLVLLCAAVIVVAYFALLRGLRPWDLAVVTLAWWLGLALTVGLAVPGASYLLTWPLVGASLGLLGAALLGDRALSGYAGVAVTMAGAAPGLLLMSSSTWLLLMSAGLKDVVTVLAVWLTAGLLVLPLEIVRRGFRWWAPAGLAVGGAVVLMLVGSTVSFDAEHPRFTSIYYRQGDRGVATWQAVDHVDGWTKQFLPDGPAYRFGTGYFPEMGVRSTVSQAAPPLRLAPPMIGVLSDSTSGDMRTVTLRLRSRRSAAVISLLVQSVVGQLSASLDGTPLWGWDTTVQNATDVRWGFDYYSPPARGIVVTLRFAAGPPLLLRAVDYTYGLPVRLAARYEPRPPGILPGRLGDGTLAETALRLPGTGGEGGAPAP
jgi:hypothetical protein